MNQKKKRKTSSKRSLEWNELFQGLVQVYGLFTFALNSSLGQSVSQLISQLASHLPAEPQQRKDDACAY